MGLANCLAPFKSKEDSPACLRFLADNPFALSVAAAWASFGPEWEQPDSPPPPETDRAALWKWVWEGVRHDWAGLCEAVDCPTEEAVQKALRQLTRLRAVFPDGTLNVHVEEMIARQVTTKSALADLWTEYEELKTPDQTIALGERLINYAGTGKIEYREAKMFSMLLRRQGELINIKIKADAESGVLDNPAEHSPEKRERIKEMCIRLLESTYGATVTLPEESEAPEEVHAVGA